MRQNSSLSEEITFIGRPLSFIQATVAMLEKDGLCGMKFEFYSPDREMSRIDLVMPRAKDALMLLLLLLVAAATTQSAVCEMSCALNVESHGCAIDMAGTGSSAAAMCLHHGAGVTLGAKCPGDCFRLLSSTSVADVAPLNAGQIILPLAPIFTLKAELRAGAAVDLAGLTYTSPPYFFTFSLRV